MFGGQPVTNDGHGLGRRDDGTIAGAGIVLDEGVRRMVAAGLDPATVIASATEVAARSLGRTDIGRIAVGAHADLVWWDRDWHPRRVWIGGREVQLPGTVSGGRSAPAATARPIDATPSTD
jgi:N-acetylglucosamine-6-phosphate deacetylase